MEIQFRQHPLPHLKEAVYQLQTQEQTQEVRLPEALPDIGRVLGCWGQVIVRGKEWRGNGMNVSGGVMAWVLYAPEDGSQPESVECWIPFQMKWDFPQTERDGFILVEPVLRAVDGRSTSARKLMVRACVGAVGQALEPAEAQISVPEEMDEDIQLLRQVYPMELPVESGEKLFDLDEELSLPDDMEVPEKLLHYAMTPKIVEQKVMAGRLVFRGNCGLEVLYRSKDGNICCWNTEVPFSQYTQLDRDVSNAVDSCIMPAVTALDMEIDEQNRWKLRCSMAAQYVIFDRILTELTEDAYSNQRPVTLQTQQLKLPMRLDNTRQDFAVSASLACHASRVLDVCCMKENPISRQNGDVTQVTVPVAFQVLYLDEEGTVQSGVLRGEESCQLPSDAENRLQIRCSFSQPEATVIPEGITVSCQCQMELAVFRDSDMTMVTGLQLGEKISPDPDRPSLILKPMAGESLWEMAKSCGSTVDAIRDANRLSGEPEKGQMLLIPVP